MASPSPNNKATTTPNSLVVKLEMYFTLASDTSTPKTRRWMGGERVQNARFFLGGTALPAQGTKGTYKIPLDALRDGAQEIEVRSDVRQTSTCPAYPLTGSSFANGPKFQYRRFNLKLSVSQGEKGRRVDDTPEVVLIPELMKIDANAVYTSPAAYALLYTWKGKQQELTIDWKPDWIQSANYNGGNRSSSDIECIVLHATATANPPIQTLCKKNGAKSVSAHYLLDVDGHVIKLVAEANIAWHAGGSFWKGKTGINDNSVGIEMVHAMNGADVKKAPARSYPDDQYVGLMVLMESLLETYSKAGRLNVVGHSDIATLKGTTTLGNKMDPYYDFQWVRLEGAGMARRGADPQASQPPGSRPPVLGVAEGKIYKLGNSAPAIAQVKQALKDIGYSIASSPAGQATVSDKYDEAMTQAVFSFQTRYWSDPNFTGLEDKRGQLGYDTAYAIQKVLEDK